MKSLPALYFELSANFIQKLGNKLEATIPASTLNLPQNAQNIWPLWHDFYLFGDHG